MDSRLPLIALFDGESTPRRGPSLSLAGGWSEFSLRPRDCSPITAMSSKPASMPQSSTAMEPASLQSR